MTGTAVNDAPTATNLSAAETYSEDTPLNLTDIVVSDVDSANVTVTLTLSDVAAGSLNTATSGAVTSTYNAATGVWTASGAIADVNTLLAGLTFTPSLNYNSNFSIATSVDDGVAPAITGSKAMTGTAVNDAPTASPVTLAPIAEDSGARLITQAELLANANDVDGDALTATGLAISVGGGTLVDNGDGTWNYTPALNDDTAVSFSYTVDDGNGGTVAGSASLDITPVNDVPTTTPVTLAPIAEDSGARLITQAELLANANDVDGDALTATGLAISVGGGTLVDNGDGTWNYTPALNDDTAVSFSYTVDDGNGGTVAGSASLDITPVNDAPVASNDSYSTNEDTALTAVLGVNDLLQNDSDVDGDSLTVNTAPVTDVTNGTLTLNADGTFTYTPNANFNGTDSFTYEVSDGNGGTATASVTITVNPVNDAPVASDTSITAIEDVVYNGTLPAASDVEGDTVTYGLGTAASNGTAVVNVDGTFSYTPNANYNGGDSFTYTIDDGNGGSNTYTVTINVAPVNDAPVANDDAFTVNEGSTTNLNLASNDTDTDDGLDLTSITIVSGPTNGSIVVNADGTVDYTHDGSETLADSFIYTIDDLSGTTSNTSIVSLTITPVNDAPIPGNDNLTTNQGTPLTITPITDLLVNDTDAEGNLLTITSFTQPANGTVVNNGDGTWTYTPDSTFNGVDSITYTVDDGNGGTATATLNLMINPVIDTTSNPLLEIQAFDTNPNIRVVNINNNTDQTIEEAVIRYEQQAQNETTTARNPSALLAVLNPPHVTNQVDVVDENTDIYGSNKRSNNDAENNMQAALFNSDLLWQELDQLRSNINGSNDDGIFNGQFSDIILSLGGLSVTSGLIAWLLRGGSLAASFITSMPLWKGMDPLPVLNRRKKDEEEEDDDTNDVVADKRVERLMKGDSAHW